MEELKPLAELTIADSRQKYFASSPEDYHKIVSAISLNPSVPSSVQDQFTIAKNAYVYSWFFYPFLPVALFYSILAIELALRLRINREAPDMFSGKRDPTLFPLLLHAIQKRWLVDSGFSIDVGGELYVPERILGQFPNLPSDQRYCYSLLDSLIALRNDLAHGEYILAPGMGRLLERGAEIINQIYPAVEGPDTLKADLG